MVTSKYQVNGQDADQQRQPPETNWAETVKAYGKMELELAKLKFVQAATRIIAIMAFRVAVFAVWFVFVLLMSMGVGLLIGDMLGKPHYGLLIISSVYLLLIVLMTFFLGGWIKRQASNAIIKELLK